MAQFPALPLWTDAYLGDCHHLTDEEHGRYLLLLILMWRSPDCRIPDDDEWIARHMRRDANAVRTHMRPLITEFCTKEGNWLFQARLRKEWKWCQDKREKNRDSANKRWGNDFQSSERISKRNAPTPTPIYIKNQNSFQEGKKGSSSMVDNRDLSQNPEFMEGVRQAKKASAEQKPFLIPKNLTDVRLMAEKGFLTPMEANFCGFPQSSAAE